MSRRRDRSRPAILRSLALFVVTLTLLLSGFTASHAQAAIYWVNFDGIGRANLDGSNAEPAFISGQLHDFTACSVAVTESHIYWGDAAHSLIGRANLDGSEPAAFVNGVTEPCALATDARHLFWVSKNPESIGRVNLDGTEVIPRLIQAQEALCGVATAGGYVYFSSFSKDTIGRATVDGKFAEPVFISKAQNACGLTVSGGQIFWGSYGSSIGRVGLDGSDLQPTLIDGLNRPCGVAASGAQLFFAEQMNLSGQGVGSANVDGTTLRRGFLPGTLPHCSVAVDSTQVPPVTPPPPRPVRCEVAGPFRLNVRTGVAFGLVYTEGEVTLTVASKGVQWRDLRERQPWNFSRILKIWPGGKGRSGKHLRQQLRRTGKVRLKLRIDCTVADPKLQSSSTEVPLTLRQARKTSHNPKRSPRAAHRRALPGWVATSRRAGRR